MAQAPLIESESVRQRIISAIMAFLLAGALGLAYGLAVKPGPAWGRLALDAAPQTIDDLQLSVPAGWQRSDSASHVEGIDFICTFTDPHQPEHKLVVAPITFAVPRSPIETISLARRILTTPADREAELSIVRPMALRVKTLVGMRDADVAGVKEGLLERFVAVLSEDGRRYWLIHMAIPVEPGRFRPQQLQVDIKVFERILNSAAPRHLRSATGDDFQQAGFSRDLPSTAWPDGLRAWVAQDSAGDEPITLLPGDEATPRLHLLRVRSILHTGLTEPSLTLSPAGLLTMRFIQVMGQHPAPGAVVRQDIGGKPVWHITFALPREAIPSLARQVWYAPLSEDRALLVEWLGEAAVLEKAVQTVPRLLAVLAATEPSPATAPAPSAGPGPLFKAATERGAALAAKMRGELPRTLSPAWFYHLIDSEKTTIGYRVAQVQPALDGDSLPLHGTTDLDFPDRHIHVNEQWACSPDGRQFQLVTRQVATAPDSSLAEIKIFHLELRNNKLRMGDVTGRTETERWTSTVPSSYLNPSADEVFPLDLLRSTDGPALLWLSVDTGPPAPYLVSLAPQGGPLAPATAPATRPVVDETITLIRRPLAGMDSDRIVLDSTGRIQRDDRYIRGSPAGESTITLRRVDRAALLSAYPSLQTQFQAVDSKEPQP